VLAWLSVWGKVRYIFAYGPADATATVAPVNPDWFCFTFLVLAHPGSPGQRAAISAPGAWLPCLSRPDARVVSLLDVL